MDIKVAFELSGVAEVMDPQVFQGGLDPVLWTPNQDAISCCMN
jgi:hypothetical protein